MSELLGESIFTVIFVFLGFTILYYLVKKEYL